MGLDLDRIPFGLATITIGEGEDVLKFDGVDEFQADGGEVTLTPLTEPINIADAGTGDYDQRVVGYEGSITIAAAQESIRVMQLALAASDAITDTTTSEVVGLMDSPIGTSLRKKGKRINIHPRHLAPTNKDMDITIYKMVSNGDFTRSTGNTQGNITINMVMFPRDGMNPSQPGNYFFTGGTDPNGATEPA